MPLQSNVKRKNWLTKALQTVCALVFVAVLFSPLQPFFSINLAQADHEPGHTTSTPTPAENPPPEVGCWIGEGGNLAICISQVVYAFTVGIGTIVGWIAAAFFSFAVGLSLQGPTYAVSFVAEGWTILRDVANMFFILILVYIAFQIMFQAETSGTMQTLVKVILIALVINFSFFATRLVVDAGNILAVQFYNLIPGDATLPLSQTKDLSQTLMQGIGVQEVLGLETFQQYVVENDFLTTVITLSAIYIAVGIMLFMIAATLLMVGVKFLVRIAVLWLVIIAAPVALVFLSFPNKKMKMYYGKWQDALLKHAFYPAVFLFVYYILTLFMISMGERGSILNSVFGELAGGEAQGLVYLGQVIANVGIRLGFVIVILYIGLRISEQLGVYGAGAARNFSSWATRTMSGATYGGTGWFMRNTLGRGAGTLYNRAERSAGFQTLLSQGDAAAHGIRAGLNLARQGSYDVRNLPGLQDTKNAKGKVVKQGLKKYLNTEEYGMGPVGQIRYDLGGTPRKSKADERIERISKKIVEKEKVEISTPTRTIPNPANDNRTPPTPPPEPPPSPSPLSPSQLSRKAEDLVLDTDGVNKTERDLTHTTPLHTNIAGAAPAHHDATDDKSVKQTKRLIDTVKSLKHAIEDQSHSQQSHPKSSTEAAIPHAKEEHAEQAPIAPLPPIYVRPPNVNINVKVSPKEVEIQSGSELKTIPNPANDNKGDQTKRAA